MKANKMMAILMMAAAVVFTACSNNDPEAVDPKIKGTDAAVEAACAQWKTSRQYWEWSEAFLFGPATTYGIDPHTDTWPFDKVIFDNLMKRYNPASDEDDATFIDDYIATGQNVAGFHAVEYLLFRDGQARKAADITTDELYYAEAASADLYLSALKLVAAWGGEISADEQAVLDEAEWEPEHNYGESFLAMTGTEQAVQMIEGARNIIGEVNEGKIGSAYTGEDEDYIESPNAYNSIQDFYDNIMSCMHSLYGGISIKQGDKAAANSLMAYCEGTAQYKDQAAVVAEKLDNALTKINSMKAPFVLNYKDQSCGDAMDALGELDDALQTLENQLKQYSDNDAQNQALTATGKQFFEKTVIPTYRGLADSGKLLAEKIANIAAE